MIETLIASSCLVPLLPPDPEESEILLNKILDRISASVGYDVRWEEKMTIVKRIFSHYFYLPYAHTHIFFIKDLKNAKVYTDYEQIDNRVVFENETLPMKSPLAVKIRIGGEQIAEHIVPLVADLVPLIMRADTLSLDISSGSAVKNKKYEDLSITYVDASEALASTNADISRILENSPIIASLHPFYVY